MPLPVHASPSGGAIQREGIGLERNEMPFRNVTETHRYTFSHAQFGERHMRALIGLSMLVLFAAMTALAQDTKTVTFNGYVVDQMCGTGMAKKANAMEKAAAHTRDCALEESCSAEGYGIFSDGKYYKFDEKGSATAKGLIEKSKRAKGLYFEASGVLSNGTLTVASLKEATPAKAVEKAKKEG